MGTSVARLMPWDFSVTLPGLPVPSRKSQTGGKAAIHAHVLYGQIGKRGKGGLGRHMTPTNFLWTVWRINTMGRS